MHRALARPPVIFQRWRLPESLLPVTMNQLYHYESVVEATGGVVYRMWKK
jgi:hypothetical protein